PTPAPQPTATARFEEKPSAPAHQSIPQSVFSPPPDSASKKKQPYKPFAGLSLSTPPPAPKPDSPKTADLYADTSIDGMQTTKEFIPSEFEAEPQSDIQPDTKTIDLATPVGGFDPDGFDSKPSQPLPEPSVASEARAKAKLVRKRYSTFAGLALNDESAPSNEQEHQHSHPEDRFEAPPPPPPPSQRDSRKERKRYSTFAGLNLSDRDSRPVSPPSAQP